MGGPVNQRVFHFQVPLERLKGRPGQLDRVQLTVRAADLTAVYSLARLSRDSWRGVGIRLNFKLISEGAFRVQRSIQLAQHPRAPIQARMGLVSPPPPPPLPPPPA
jgi:hypothetical protein